MPAARSSAHILLSDEDSMLLTQARKLSPTDCEVARLRICPRPMQARQNRLGAPMPAGNANSRQAAARHDPPPRKRIGALLTKRPPGEQQPTPNVGGTARARITPTPPCAAPAGLLLP